MMNMHKDTLIFPLLEELFLNSRGFFIIHYWNGSIHLRFGLKKSDIMVIRSSLTVLFENPFWIGLYERIEGDKYEVCKITFGAEPKAFD